MIGQLYFFFFLKNFVITRVELIHSADDDEYTGRDFTYGEQVLNFDETFDTVVVDGCNDAFNRRKQTVKTARENQNKRI